MRHSKSSRLPSSSCLIEGFFAKVGAMPSICLQNVDRTSQMAVERGARLSNIVTRHAERYMKGGDDRRGCRASIGTIVQL